MKRILTRIAIVMLTVLMCASGLSIQLQADSNDKVENIYVNDIIVTVGKEKWIEYSVYPDEYYDDVSLVWTSSDESIVKVGRDGCVTGVKPGKTTVTVALDGRPEVNATVEVLVTEGVGCAVLQDNGDLVFFRSNDDENANEMTDLNGKVYKGKMLFYDVEDYWFNFCWKDDEVRESIKKAYVAEGNTMYFLDLQNYFCKCTNLAEADLRGFNTEYCTRYAHMFAECTSLKRVDMSTMAFTGKASYTYNMFGECNELTEVVLSSKIEIGNMLWQLPYGKWSNGSVSLTAEELGNQYPEHASEWAGTWTRKLVPATNIAFEYDEYEVNCPNWSIDLKVIITPEDGTPTLEWKSSDESIAEVWNEGTVIGISPGDVTITVRTTDGTNLTATCIVHVIPLINVETFKFTKKEYEVSQGRSIDFEYEMTPENADIRTTNWYCSDDSIAQVWMGGVYGVKQGTVTVTVKDDDGNVLDTCKVTVTEPADWAGRVFGSNRYKTSMAIAEAFRDWFTDGKNENIILACGTNFADALAGSYLSAVKYAPIIIINDANIDRVKEYVKTSLEPTGTVYILGGEVAVSAKVEKEIKKVATNVKRLAGSNRYDTNLKILEEAGMDVDTILVATGTNFADSLSASAAGLPMLLVKDSLNDDQKAFLKKNKDKKIYILGGEKAVVPAVEKELKKYGNVERLAGNSRFETSVMIAEKFFDDPYYVMVAFSNDYPDGLCGGPIGVVIGAPLILTRSDNLTAATKYCKDHDIHNMLVFGGEARLTDKNIKTLLSSKKVDITKYEYKGD